MKKRFLESIQFNEQKDVSKYKKYYLAAKQKYKDLDKELDKALKSNNEEKMIEIEDLVDDAYENLIQRRNEFFIAGIESLLIENPPEKTRWIQDILSKLKQGKLANTAADKVEKLLINYIQ